MRLLDWISLSTAVEATSLNEVWTVAGVEALSPQPRN